MKQHFLIKMSMVLAFGITVAGCAAIEKSNAMDTERMLAAAGFKMRFADTPQKLANVQAMTQRKVVPHSKDGAVYYAYADAEFCKCLYLGSENAYQQYEKTAIEQNIAEMNEDAAMDWGAWGPWGGWGPWY